MVQSKINPSLWCTNRIGSSLQKMNKISTYLQQITKTFYELKNPPLIIAKGEETFWVDSYYKKLKGKENTTTEVT